jgi:opacity protein-like surface antigen
MKRFLLLLFLVAPFAASSQQKTNTNMTHVLKNKNIEIQIDLPTAGYSFSRFDWTGKIVSVKYKNIPVSSVEMLNNKDDTQSGKGFYNEFGIEAPVGYNEIEKGGWFHKIGVGLLKKDSGDYFFGTRYEIRPAGFKVIAKADKITIHCKSENANGYAYEYEKEIELTESGFVVKYYLKNTGAKTIITNEYIHNFIAINNEFIGSDYILKFPFRMDPLLFDATVNPEGKVEIGQQEITFNDTPTEQFFFSNLTGNQNIDAYWELINTKSKIGISETGSFKTAKVNLWGWKHVISPELFFDVNLEPGKEIEWSRIYRIFEIN